MAEGERRPVPCVRVVWVRGEESLEPSGMTGKLRLQFVEIVRVLGMEPGMGPGIRAESDGGEGREG